MVERAMALVRGCVQLAWWDGSCLGLRLHRLTDLIEFVASPPDRVAVPVRAGDAA